ncbi:MAG: Zn-dependent hydrolase [Bacteroidetes bacterium 4572_114]|nr:MAG: Zn-dependent hydrolase [Bacteroidetes bacterium 4572_114]
MSITSCGGPCGESIEGQRAGIIPQGVDFEPLPGINMKEKLNEFAPFKLTADISHLSDNEKQILPYLFDAAKIMESLYWKQAIGNKKDFLSRIENADAKKFAHIQYGPWDRLNNNKTYLTNVGPKPAGANFYPEDMTKEEFEALEGTDKKSLYTLIRRDDEGNLKVIWYHEAYKEELEKAAVLLRKAANLADNEGLKKYLTLRADALVTDEFLPSDLAWMDMKTSNIDFVVGPIENYEDQLFGYKAAYESFILIKDPVWSKRLSKFAAMLPDLQKIVPTDEKYKKDMPGSDSDLNAYDVVYYAGDCNAGSKTIAINLPNDPKVHASKGTRKLQLKNAMQAKFDKILVPISKMLIAPEQQGHVTFDAFFANTMFHEVAHGMGVKNTINGKGTAREALKETYSSIEEGKADIMGLWLVVKLREMGEITEGELMDNYVTFFAGIFRSSRFGTASAHGKANMMRFAFFREQGAFARDADGFYKVNPDKMEAAINILVDKIQAMQGEGDYEAAKAWIAKDGKAGPDLKADLDRLNQGGIPVDIVFIQGPEVMGLK